MIVYGSIIISLFAFLLAHFAGRKESVNLFTIAFFFWVLASIICIFAFHLVNQEGGDSCSEVGGRYELDERIRDGNGPAMDVYKCVRN